METKTRPELVIDVRPRMTTSSYVVAPFDEAKEALEAQGYRVISAQENARLRMQEGIGSDISRNGNWTREGFLYVPDRGVFLTRNSPIMANARKATKAHRSGKGYYLTDTQVEQALGKNLVDSINITNTSIPTNRFGEDQTTLFVFGEEAESYGRFLKDEGKIEAMPVYLTEVGKKPFARQMWFRFVDTRSEFGGNFRGLGVGNRLRGVSEGAEGTQKISKGYTDNKISVALKELGFSGLEKDLLGRLKNK